MLPITVPKKEASNNHDEGAMQMIPHLRVTEDYGVPHTFHVGTDFRGILDLNRGVPSFGVRQGVHTSP